ncbi:SWIM zinc finger family protein [Paenibacillus periandrae]|uniref:SWIM zinc finger family protein n=1 Tax=Paenibacillus periandrae TaxID=1761741 RepID=UPI001F09AB2E|nr:SWIM zinc finger family protein [Paenibacillus periandrae]
MLKLQIPKNRLNYLIERMQQDFELSALERGWQYVHKGRVKDIELRHGMEIHAQAHGAELYEVILDLEQFAKSSCTCPKGKYCQHKAAVIFALYAPYARPEILLQQLKQAILVKSRQQQTRAATGSTKAEKKAERLEPPQADQLPAQWQRFFDQQFYGYSLSQQNSIELFYHAAQDSLRPIASKWETSIRQLFELHVLLFVMRKVEQFISDSKASYLASYMDSGSKIIAKLCQEQLDLLLPQMDCKQIASSYPEALDETLALLGELALNGNASPMQWLVVYRSLWWKLEGQPKRLTKERKRLEQLAAKASAASQTGKSDPGNHDSILMALAHFQVMEQHDEEARALLSPLAKKEARDFFLYLHRFYEEMQWERMLDWLRWLLPTIQRAQQEELRIFCTYWMEAVSRQPDDNEWVEVMIALLPRTYYFYTSYLMKSERFRSWIDLQIANRVSPIDLYTADLKMVEAKDPSLLLPLYHQAVERCIAEKNRNSYKLAMKYLKKLQAYYTKLGKPQIWDEYIYLLSTRYSRLRALQEELRKGKWIP